MTIEEIERASRKAWPALIEQQTAAGVLRCAGGVSRRANSMTPAARATAGAVMAHSERFYFSRGLPSIVRVLMPSGALAAETRLLDASLAAAGYESQALTATLVATLPVGRAGRSSQELSVTQPESWLDGFCQVNGAAREDFALRLQILQAISDPARFLWIGSAGEVVATAMAVCSGPALGIYGVATAAARRRCGLARALLQELLAWGAENGSRYAYLHVEKDNHAALNLYSGMGFQELYSYWYRVKPPIADVQPRRLQQEIRP